MIRATNAIPVSRETADIGAIKRVLAELKKGEGVCLYPEGTRSDDGKITSFKPGFSLLCRRSCPCWSTGRTNAGPAIRSSSRRARSWSGSASPYPSPEQIRTMSNEQLADWPTPTLRQMPHERRLKQGKQPYDYSA